MSPLPRLERGDAAAVHIAVAPWTDLGDMLKSVVDGVKETGQPVLSDDHPTTRCIGFHMEQLDGDDIRWWSWEIHCDDLNRGLSTPEWQHLDKAFKSATGRAQIAATLSEGKLP